MLYVKLARVKLCSHPACTSRFWVYFIFFLIKFCAPVAFLSKPVAAPRINMWSKDRKLQAKLVFISSIAA